MFKNILKNRLQNGETLVGAWIQTNSFDNAEIMAHAGLDFVMIDGEHGSMDVTSAGPMVSIIRANGVAPLYRVEWNRIETIKRGLDTGAYGVMVPYVCSKEEAEQAVAACKYPPAGLRGSGLGRASFFGADFGYFDVADREIMVILQVEHYSTVEHVEEILSVPGIDVLFLGPADLSTSMGLAGQFDHPDVVRAFKTIADACKRHGIAAGTVCDLGQMKKYADMGYRFFIGGMDSRMIYDYCSRLMAEKETI